MQEQDVFGALRKQGRISNEGGVLAVKPKPPTKEFEVVTYCNNVEVSRLEIDDPFITTTVGPILKGRNFAQTIIKRLRGCMDMLRGELSYKIRVRATNSETSGAVMNLAYICNLCQVPRFWRGEKARERMLKHQWSVHAEEMARPRMAVGAAALAESRTRNNKLEELLAGDHPEDCLYCWHRWHGRVTRNSLATIEGQVNTNGRCLEQKSEVGRTCNCDGRSQWFAFNAASKTEALEWLVYALAAGYQAYPYDDMAYTVTPVDASGAPRDSVMATVFSERLAPVISRAHFEMRCQFPVHLRQPETAKVVSDAAN